MESQYKRRGWTVGLSPCHFERSRWKLGHMTTPVHLYTQLELAYGTVLFLAHCRNVVTIEHILVHRRSHLPHGWEIIGEAEEKLREKRTKVAFLRVPGSCNNSYSIVIDYTNSLFRSALKWDDHRAHIFFSNNQILKLINFSWTWVERNQLKVMKFNFNFPDEDLCTQVVNDGNSGYGIDFYTRKSNSWKVMVIWFSTVCLVPSILKQGWGRPVWLSLTKKCHLRHKQLQNAWRRCKRGFHEKNSWSVNQIRII